MTDSKKPTNVTAELYVYGLDKNGKPRGARFPATEMEKLFPVVEKLGLSFYEGSTEKLIEVGAKLPVGRIYARGNSFIPNIKQALYDQIVSALAEFKKDAAEGQAVRTAAATAERVQAGKEPPILSGLPGDWTSIGSGHCVLVEEPGEGYWPGIVIERQEDVVTIRFRDFPKVKPFKRHITELALLYPGPTP